MELNKVFLVGNLTRDPELKYIPSGTAVCDLGLASNRRFSDRNSGDRKEETLFINVTAWGKTAEFCNQYLKKGRAILVEGRLKRDTWQDNEGHNREKIYVVADRIQFADPKPGGQGGPGGPGGGEPAAREFDDPGQPAAAPSGGGGGGGGDSGGGGEGTKDDLPF